MLEKVFDTEDIPLAERVDAWHDTVAQWLDPNVIHVDHAAAFRATVRTTNLGNAQVASLTYSSMRTSRTERLIRRSDPELYKVALVLRGQQGIDQAGRQTVPGAGNLVAHASFYPYEAWVDADGGTAATITAQVPRALISLPRDRLDGLLATRLSGQEGIGALLAHFLVHLATDTTPQRPGDGPRLGTILLDLFTAFLAHHLDDVPMPSESRQRALFLRVQAFIHQHLSDPRLTTAAVAAAHHVSARHLQQLFQRHGESVAAFIRGQRLERIRRDLADPALAGRPVHAVAARWGLTNPAHFSRVFKAAYGVSPRDYRESGGGAATA